MPYQRNLTRLNHHQNVIPDSIGIQTAQLTEFRTGEYQEERVGYKYTLSLILCFLNCEPGHATTLNKS